MARSGIYVGNGDDANPVATLISNYETWLGKSVDIVSLHTGAAGWGDWSSSIGWQLWNHRDVINTHDIHWSIPLIPNWDSSMWSAAQGQYNTRYIEAARTIANGTPGTDPIIIRTGWEFNATWSPHSSSAMGQPQNYIGAFRNFVDSFKSVSDRFVFEWTPNIGDQGMAPSLAYPGDDYVDIIGMDFYWDSKQPWSITDPVQAWNSFVTQPYGLQWLEDFASSRGKPTAYSEWGVNSDNAGYFIEQAANWFKNHNVVFQSYWEANYSFEGELHNNQYANTAAIFLEMFGVEQTVLPERPNEIQTIAAWQTWKKGTSSAETLYGGDKNDSINGGGGKDIISGGRGDDRYTYYGTETFIEHEGEGIDSVGSWTKGLTVLHDNIEYLYIQANFAQEGHGNSIANAIIGGSPNNIINGKGGNDWLTGGGGADIFVHQKGGGHDVITDFKAGQNMNVLKLEGHRITSFYDLQKRMFQDGNDSILVLENGDAVTFLNTQKSSFKQSDFMMDQIYGSHSNDDYTITNGNEVIYETAGGGTDTVKSWISNYILPENIENIELMMGLYLNQSARGNSLNNVMIGGDANNTIRGEAGSDIISGGKGQDILYGGAGSDIFIFNGAGKDYGTDRIKDFSLSENDKIDLRGLISDFDPVTKSITDFVEITQSGQNSILKVKSTATNNIWTEIAIIENNTNLSDESSLYNSGKIIV